MAKATGNKAAAPKKAAAKKAAAPPKKAAAPPKKTAIKKAAAPAKAATKKVATKKVATKKVATKNAPKAASKTAPKASPKKVSVKQSTPAKAAPKKVAPKKAAPVSDETMLEKLFLDSIKDIYYAEKAGSRALPKMARAATSEQLKGAFEQHAQQTNGQVQRLEQVFELLGKKAQGKKCEAIEGLVKEADSMIKDTEKGSMTRDVALIMAAQKMEHYEIATYGSIATLAALMGQSQAKELLGQSLQEEKDTDELLSQIALSNVNKKAEQEGSEDEVSNKSSQGKDESLDPKAGDDGNTED